MFKMNLIDYETLWA